MIRLFRRIAATYGPKYVCDPNLIVSVKTQKGIMGDQTNSSAGVPRNIPALRTVPQFRPNNFDLLRILAATQVLYFHALTYLKVPIPTWAVPFENLPGVPIFFVISGYLISASYERSGNLTTYFRNRFLRIYPGLWCCLLLTIITVSVFNFSLLRPEAAQWFILQLGGFIYTPKFLSNFGFGSYNGSLWTIPVELQFYVFLPAVYALSFSEKRRNTVIWSMFLIFSVIYLLTLYLLPQLGGPEETPYEKLFRYSFVPHFFLFLAGVILQRCNAFKYKIISGKGFIWLLSYLVFCAMVSKTPISNFSGRIMLAITVISLAYTLPTTAKKLLNGNDISYGVYIYHALIINVLVSLGLTRRAGYVLVVWIGAYIMGYLSWILIERRFLRKKRNEQVEGTRAAGFDALTASSPP
jgi:peptidoglycan/LPS O-acetylase OafA/YrhL